MVRIFGWNFTSIPAASQQGEPFSKNTEPPDSYLFIVPVTPPRETGISGILPSLFSSIFGKQEVFQRVLISPTRLPEESEVEKLRKLTFLRKPLEEAHFSSDGLSGIKLMVESSLGRPLSSQEWPDDVSVDDFTRQQAMRGSLLLAEKVLRGRIVNELGKAVSPEALIIDNFSARKGIKFAQDVADTLSGVEFARVRYPGADVRKVRIRGNEADFVESLRTLSDIDSSEEFLNRLQAVVDVAKATSLAAGIENALSAVSLMEDGLKNVHGNVLDNLAMVMGDKDPAPLQNGHPDYEMYEATNMREDLEAARERLVEARTKLETGDVNLAAMLLAGVASSKAFNIIPDAIGLEQAIAVNARLKVFLASIAIAAPLSNIARLASIPYLEEVVGTETILQQLEVVLMSRLAAGYVFAGASTLTTSTLLMEPLPDLGAFAKKGLLTSGMLLFFGAPASVLKAIIPTEGLLGGVAYVTIGLPMTIAAFQSWAYTEAHIENVFFGGKLVPDAAFEPMAVAEGGGMAIALDIMNYATGGLVGPIQAGVYRKAMARREARILAELDTKLGRLFSLISGVTTTGTDVKAYEATATSTEKPPVCDDLYVTALPEQLVAKSDAVTSTSSMEPDAEKPGGEPLFLPRFVGRGGADEPMYLALDIDPMNGECRVDKPEMLADAGDPAVPDESNRELEAAHRAYKTISDVVASISGEEEPVRYLGNPRFYLALGLIQLGVPLGIVEKLCLDFRPMEGSKAKVARLSLISRIMNIPTAVEVMLKMGLVEFLFANRFDQQLAQSASTADLALAGHEYMTGVINKYSGPAANARQRFGVELEFNPRSDSKKTVYDKILAYLAANGHPDASMIEGEGRFQFAADSKVFPTISETFTYQGRSYLLYRLQGTGGVILKVRDASTGKILNIGNTKNPMDGLNDKGTLEDAYTLLLKELGINFSDPIGQVEAMKKGGQEYKISHGWILKDRRGELAFVNFVEGRDGKPGKFIGNNGRFEVNGSIQKKMEVEGVQTFEDACRFIKDEFGKDEADRRFKVTDDNPYEGIRIPGFGDVVIKYEADMEYELVSPILTHRDIGTMLGMINVLADAGYEGTVTGHQVGLHIHAEVPLKEDGKFSCGPIFRAMKEFFGNSNEIAAGISPDRIRRTFISPLTPAFNQFVMSGQVKDPTDRLQILALYSEWVRQHPEKYTELNPDNYISLQLQEMIKEGVYRVGEEIQAEVNGKPRRFLVMGDQIYFVDGDGKQSPIIRVPMAQRKPTLELRMPDTITTNPEPNVFKIDSHSVEYMIHFFTAWVHMSNTAGKPTGEGESGSILP